MNGNGHGIVVGYEYVLKEQGQRATRHIQGSASSAISLSIDEHGAFLLSRMDGPRSQLAAPLRCLGCGKTGDVCTLGVLLLSGCPSPGTLGWFLATSCTLPRSYVALLLYVTHVCSVDDPSIMPILSSHSRKHLQYLTGTRPKLIIRAHPIDPYRYNMYAGKPAGAR
jgi:hypothetical protein